MSPASLTAQLTAWRRDFHRHPELSFCEFLTAALPRGGAPHTEIARELLAHS